MESSTQKSENKTSLRSHLYLSEAEESLILKAKTFIMDKLQLSENEAYCRIRRAAQNYRLKMSHISSQLLSNWERNKKLLEPKNTNIRTDKKLAKRKEYLKRKYKDSGH